MAANPMTQFEVYRIGPEIKIGSFDISFTNASLFMVISSLAILIIFNLGSKKNSLLPNKIQLLAELSYTFVSKMISDTAGSKAKPYFAFIFSHSSSRLANIWGRHELLLLNNPIFLGVLD